MKTKTFSGIVIIFALFSFYNLIDHQHIFPQFLISPDGQTIADQFVDAVISGDLELATDLTDGSLECKERMAETLEEYSIYEGLEIENVVANAYQYTDSPSEGFVNILALTNSEDDLDGFTIRLRISYTIIGKRFTCGEALPEL